MSYLDDDSLPWQQVLKRAIELYVKQNVDKGLLDVTHTEDTPKRVVHSFSEYVSGYLEDPKQHLQTLFAGDFDEMVHFRRIRVTSFCAHHLQPIIGTAHFAYIPKGYIVGLSKVPRFISVLSRRLQVQENLTEEIVNTFQHVVQPSGCAVNIKAYHCCMMLRGVREHASITETTAFRGCFRHQVETRSEFLSALNHSEVVFP